MATTLPARTAVSIYRSLQVRAKPDRPIAKFWFKPVSLAKNLGFADHELRAIERLDDEHREFLIEAWHEYFDA